MAGSLYATDPPIELRPRGESKAVPSTLAIVWPCPLGVDEYEAAGRDVEVPRPDCPDAPLARSVAEAEARVHLTYTRHPDGDEAVRAEVRGEMSRVGEGT